MLLVFFGSACGGGGGGNGSTDGGTDSGGTGTLTNVQLIGTIGSNVGVGLTNLAVGDTVQLQFVGQDSSGRQVTRTGSSFSTTAPSSVATISSDGVLTVHGVSGGTYSVSGLGPNGVLTRDFSSTAPQAFVTGRVKNVNNTGVAVVRVMFYNDSGSLLGTAVTGPSGLFRANVPGTASGFTIDVEAADPATSFAFYYRQYGYNNKYYLNGMDCRATSPDLTSGTTTALPSDIVLAARASGPPPPPSGCVGG